MTAFRKVRDCGEGKRYTKAENIARNRSLLSKLKSMGYGVTSLKGVYPEGGNTEKRKNFFIFVSQDKGSLLTDVKRLGEEFDQNSVLLSGGWGVVKSMGRMQAHFKGDERILGDSKFVMHVLESARERMEERYRLVAQGHTFDRIIGQLSDCFGLSVEDILSLSKHPLRFKARSAFACLAVRKLGIDGTAVGKRLGVGQSAISRAVARGE